MQKHSQPSPYSGDRDGNKKGPSGSLVGRYSIFDSGNEPEDFVGAVLVLNLTRPWRPDRDVARTHFLYKTDEHTPS